MKVLHAAGFHVIPRENIVTLAHEKIVPMLEMHRFGRDPNFADAVIRDMLTGMSASLGKVAELTTSEDLATNGRRFQARTKLLSPCALWSDPYERELFARMREPYRESGTAAV